MASKLKVSQVTDLTHFIANGMPVYPGSDEIALNAIASADVDGYNELEFTITGHIGTHIDCGLHMFNNGFDTGSTLPEHFIGTGIVIDCRACGYQIPEKLLKSEQKRIKKAEFILLYTGWDQFWGKARYFENFPVLNEQAAEFLTRFSLKGIGIDAPSFDTVHSTDLPVHHILLSKGILLVENLTNLKNISESEFIFSCFPLKIQGGDGSPVRAVGIRL